MKFKRILALLLSVVLLSNTAYITAFAADKTEEEEIINVPLADYTMIDYSSPIEKLATMKLYVENDKYQLWGLEETGEIAFVTKSTGQILFSNPYDVATISKDKTATETKQKLLSQITLKYSSESVSGAYMYSYKDAAIDRQISMENIRGGLRVNYTMGREEARILVPEVIEKSTFESRILEKMPQKDETGRTIVDEVINKNPYTYMKAYFQLKDAFDETMSENARNKMMQTFPITKKYAVYMLSTDTSVKEKKNLEHLINTYTDYTFDDLMADHAKVEHESSYEPLPLFRVALEYYLDDEGLKVRVSANDIRFNASAFSLESITILPYFGAGTAQETGYTLVADGSGSIIRFEDIAQSNAERNITSKVYGQDYSFHQVGGANQEVVRLPSYGVIRDMSYTGFDTDAYLAAVEAGEITAYDDIEGQRQILIAKATEEAAKKAEEEARKAAIEAGEIVEEEIVEEPEETTEGEAVPEEEVNPYLAQSSPYVKAEEITEETSGYIAYVEEGESMAEITTSHGGVVHKYNSAYATFVPRPSDQYELDGMSVSGSAMWTVTAERKYTGNFTIRYIPVSGEKATTAGMAEALRNYLINKGILTRLEDDGNNNIPLYLEHFGSIETTQRVAGVPFDVQTPLTTFDDCRTILEELKNGITINKGTKDEKTLSASNVVVKYTGWYNGGLYKTAPSNIKIDKAVGNADSLAELVEYANANGSKIYPDLEFTYVNKVGSFDGFDYKDDAIQTMDGRTAVHKVYSALYQRFDEDGQLILSPLAMSNFYEKSAQKYLDLGVDALSVASLGEDLSSNHNKDYAFTREDSKETISMLLSQMQEDNGSLLVSGGNAYVLPYVDHIVNVPLNSSENVFSTESVPFYGMVLHGCVNFAGTAINLDGDFEKSLLKAIENGASPYFILSARNENTSELKSFVDFSKYYSIRYNIWKEDLVETYNILNEALGDVKYETITNHEYIDTRVVKVEYSNGTTFILNYNTNPVTVGDVTVEAMGFVKQ